MSVWVQCLFAHPALLVLGSDCQSCVDLPVWQDGNYCLDDIMLAEPNCSGFGVVNPLAERKDSYSLLPVGRAWVREKFQRIDIGPYVNSWCTAEYNEGPQMTIWWCERSPSELAVFVKFFQHKNWKLTQSV